MTTFAIEVLKPGWRYVHAQIHREPGPAGGQKTASTMPAMRITVGRTAMRDDPGQQRRGHHGATRKRWPTPPLSYPLAVETGRRTTFNHKRGQEKPASLPSGQCLRRRPAQLHDQRPDRAAAETISPANSGHDTDHRSATLPPILSMRRDGTTGGGFWFFGRTLPTTYCPETPAPPATTHSNLETRGAGSDLVDRKRRYRHTVFHGAKSARLSDIVPAGDHVAFTAPDMPFVGDDRDNVEYPCQNLSPRRRRGPTTNYGCKKK